MIEKARAKTEMTLKSFDILPPECDERIISEKIDSAWNFYYGVITGAFSLSCMQEIALLLLSNKQFQAPELFLKLPLASYLLFLLIVMPLKSIHLHLLNRGIARRAIKESGCY